MFWRHLAERLARTALSPVEALLEKDNLTLEELLDEEDIIKQCRALNIKLITFLRDRTHIEQLLRYIVEEAPEDADINRAFKFPYIACEIFTCEIDVIVYALLADEELMNLLFSFLKPNRPHSSSLSGHFSKVVLCLLLRKTVPLMNYVQAHQYVFGQLVDLIGNTSIMEVLARIVEPAGHLYPSYIDVMQWLADNNLLEMIVDRLSHNDPPQVGANAAEILCAITRTAPSPLATKLSSPSFVSRLFDHALEKADSNSALVNSLSVLISLLDPRKAIPTSQIYSIQFQHTIESSVPANPDTVLAMLPKLGDLVVMLCVSADAKILPTTYGVLRPPLGKHRLKIVEFMAVLLDSGIDVVVEELISSGAIQIILDLLFEYPYHNELHHSVESIIYTCLGSENDIVVNHILNDCNLVGKILQADKNPNLSGDSNKPTAPTPGKKVPKAGYHGHLTRICNKIVHLESRDPRIMAHTQENREWNDWRTDVLQERNVVEDVCNWDCGRPTGLEDSMIDSDEEDAPDRDYEGYEDDGAEEAEGALDRDDEDVYYDNGEVVIKSVKLDDDSGSSLVTNPNWFAFQDDIIDDILRSSPLTAEMDEINETSTSNRCRSGSDVEMVAGKDDGLPEGDSSSSLDNISSGEKIAENEEDLNLQMEKAGTSGNLGFFSADGSSTDDLFGYRPTQEQVACGEASDLEAGASSINLSLHEMDSAETSPSGASTGEILPNDTSTSASSSDSVASEPLAAPVPSLSEKDVGFDGVELEGTKTEMEQALEVENPEGSGPGTNESDDANF